MSDQTSTLSTPDGQMEVYEAAPSGDARSAVVVIQEAFGVNEHIKDVTRRFAAVGYHAIAPSLFHRAGGGTADYGDFGAVIPLYEGVSDDGVLADIDATLDHLREAGFNDNAIGVVGFCFGGRASFLVSARRALGAGVGFYGGGIVSKHALGFDSLIDDTKSLQTPWLGLFGDADGGIPVEDVETLRTALKDAPVETKIVRYPDAEHGFHCDVRDSYHPEAAADAWQQTLAWFEAHLGPPA